MATEGRETVGGGVKKILYALQTIQRIGLLDSKKALSSNNTCKACGLGMGGQRGGMTNELGEFPAVCNKSIQAQSTDIQPPIPSELFDFTLQDFRALSPHELEHLGRLAKPLYKAPGANSFTEVDWSWAISHAVQKLTGIQAERSFFYSSGRSSNEAGFVFQLLARLYGTNNVNNCSYYCHQATSVGLSSTIGTGTATVELADLDHTDCIFVIGANPASNHPRFIHKLKACRDRGGQVIVINPAKESGLVKFALPKSAKSLLSGGSEIASRYLQPRVGSDILLLKGIAKAVLEAGLENAQFVDQFTTNFASYKSDIADLDWSTIEEGVGLSKDEIEAVALDYGRAKSAVFSWGMGITHHAHGVDNVEAIAGLCMLRGMLGRPGAGLLPLRGHSNVQGIGTMGVKPVVADEVFQAMQHRFGVQLPDQRTQQGLDTLACMEAAERGEIDAAVVMGGNLYAATPNSAWAEKALAKIGFKLFLTTTLNAGHVNACDDTESLVLPVTARDEEPEPTTQESMFNFVRLSDGGITRIADARSEVSILADLGQGLCGTHFDFLPFKQHDTVREAIADIVPGLAELKTISIAKKEFHIRNRLMHSPQFKTKDGRGHFVVTNNIRFEGDRPFTLTSVRSEGQFNSIIYEQNDSYRDVDQRWAVMMNNEDMRDMQLSLGSLANLRSDDGEMLGVKVYPFDLPKGNLMAYYPEANVLIGLNRDSRSQTPAFKSVSVTVEKVN